MEVIFFYICPLFRKMIWIERPHTDPWFNLAAEEFILKHTQNDVMMLWQNSSSVVVGKHQNMAAEVNLRFTDAHHIPVIRRLSGGGTVYHDKGNINYTLIRSAVGNGFPVDFKAFTQPLILFLKQFDLEASFEGKNNLRIGHKKFSGNAAHVFKNKVMHHGTLLFNSDLALLEKIIQPHQEQFVDKSIKSVRAEVTNLTSLLPADLGIDSFKRQFKAFLLDYFGISTLRSFTGEEEAKIQALAQTKYKSWEWNMGYSPRFLINKTVPTPDGLIRAKIQVKAGIIEGCSLFLAEKELTAMEKKLMHQPYQKEVLLPLLADNPFSETLKNILF